MRIIKGYYARYWVSRGGKVYDALKGFLRVPEQMEGTGYMVVRLVPHPFFRGVNRQGEPYTTYVEVVHRLVLEAYTKHKNPWWNTVNHMNCVNIDNRLENLEWVTSKENIRHAYVMGRKTTFRISYFSVYSVTTDKGTYNKFAGIKNGQTATGYMTKGKFYPAYGSENKFEKKIKG